MSALHHYDHPKHRTRMVRMDDGRQLLAMTALAAGGAVTGVSLFGLVYTFAYVAPTPLILDIVAAVAGALVSFVYLVRTAASLRRWGKD
jgi:hypothetical protein